MSTYFFMPDYKFATPDGRDAIDVAYSAMKKWAASGLVNFQPGIGENQITFEFGTLGNGVVAHTYLPDQDNDYTRIVFNKDVSWNLSLGWWRFWPFTKGFEMLEEVFCHELGHVLFDAGHAPNNVNSVMVHNDDVNGIHQAPFPTKWDFEQLKKRL
jgi:hypothetical protein